MRTPIMIEDFVTPQLGLKVYPSDSDVVAEPSAALARHSYSLVSIDLSAVDLPAFDLAIRRTRPAGFGAICWVLSAPRAAMPAQCVDLNHPLPFEATYFDDQLAIERNDLDIYALLGVDGDVPDELLVSSGPSICPTTQSRDSARQCSGESFEHVIR
ncbi:hypothetical protein WI72_08895 [Burkholderia ubonensis]|nr:hypothetical protein WI72_08895 [Burkholderia ubonensis]KVD92858.1 hypothetical protein WI90_10365 [Burkholderia ubonensis]